MSRQDADDDNTSEATTAGSEESDGQATDREHSETDEAEQSQQETGETPEGSDEILDEIAEEPAADTEEILDEITGEKSAEDTEEETNLVGFVEEQSAEAVADLITTLRAERAELEDELERERERADDLESRLSRKQADFQNYKKRQQERMEEEKQRATEDLVERLLDVRDNLARALDQDGDTEIRGGVESTLVQFDEELDRENVEVIEPELGTEVDPQRHEVLIKVESDQPEDTVAQLHRPGYEMAGKVLRPAQVAVSDGSGADDEAE